MTKSNCELIFTIKTDEHRESRTKRQRKSGDNGQKKMKTSHKSAFHNECDHD